MSLSFFLHTFKWFQVLLSNSNNLVSVICLHTKFVLFDPLIGPYQVLGQSGHGSNGNEGQLCISQISLSDGLMSYLGHSLGRGSYLSAEMPLVYSTAPANWAGKAHLV